MKEAVVLTEESYFLPDEHTSRKGPIRSGGAHLLELATNPGQRAGLMDELSFGEARTTEGNSLGRSSMLMLWKFD
jgi:hypothetical protein